MKGFFDTIPAELDESARVDGATPAQIFWGVDPAARRAGARRRRAHLLRLHAQRVRDREHAAADRRRSTRSPSGCRATSTSSTREHWGPFAAGRAPGGDSVMMLFFVAPAVHRRADSPGRGQGMSAADVRGRAGDAARRAAPRRLGRVRRRAPRRARRHARRPRCGCRAGAADERRRSATSSTASRAPSRRSVDDETEPRRWWRAAFRVDSPSDRYRWLLAGGDGRLHLAERRSASSPTTSRTRTTSCSPPTAAARTGTSRSVVYEIFPDRFASSGRRAARRPTGRSAREWDELPTGRGRDDAARAATAATCGGVEAAARPHRGARRERDLPDAVLPGGQHAPLRRDLVRPRRPAARRRRGARARSSRAAHARGMRVARRPDAEPHRRRPRVVRRRAGRPARPSGTSTTSTRRCPRGYASWLGVPSLPKLNWRSAELRAPACADVVRRWLEPPFGLDGWRIDVANMTGRFARDVDLSGRGRRAARAERARPTRCSSPSTAHDFRADLAGGGWHGAMNYAGFLRPAW